MRVLLTISEKLLNPYPRELYDRLQAREDLTYDFGLNRFWLPNEFDYDIIHIHWPETLITNLLNPDFIVNSDHFRTELFSLDQALRTWKQKARIVFTRHNDIPHQGKNEFYDLLYRLVHKYADAIIHLGQYSKDQFLRTVETPSNALHTVIPHSIYESYPDSTDRKQSRSRLNIPTNAFVLLVFGSVRTREEEAFILEVFNGIEASGKILVAPRWNTEDFSRHGRILGYLRERIYHARMKFRPHFRFGTNRASIGNEEVQYYFHAADLVLSPRQHSLNSGVIPLACTFGKPVVGPDTGNITELLSLTGNPIFEPGNARQAADQINGMIRQNTLESQGIHNRTYGREHWNVDKISRSHLELFRELLNG